MKRILSFILSAIMVVSCFAVVSFADSAAVDSVEALIDAIGDVTYKTTAAAGTVTTLEFDQTHGHGYSNLNKGGQESDVGPYHLIMEVIPREYSKDLTAVSSLGVTSNGGGGLYYDFMTKKFVINTDGFNYGGYNPGNILAESKEYELVNDVKYTIEFVLEEGKTAIIVDGREVCSTPTSIWNGYCIIYPRDCKLSIASYKQVTVDGTVIAEATGDQFATDLNDDNTPKQVKDTTGGWVGFAGYGETGWRSGISVDYLSFSDSLFAIEDAEAAYAALSDDDKAAVSNYDKLTAAREAYDVKVAAAVDALIAAIGTPSVTTGDAAIDAAESAYGKLSDAQKAKVSKYDALVAARESYEILASVGVVEDKINLVEGIDITDATEVGGLVKAYPEGFGYTDAGQGNNVLKDDAYLSVSYDMMYSSYTTTADGKQTFFGGSTDSYGSSGKIAVGYDFQNQRFFIGSFTAFAFNGNIDNIDASVNIALDPGVWYNVNIIYDRKYVSVYLDGLCILEHEYDENPSFSWYICAARNVSLTLDNFGWMNYDEDQTGAIRGGDPDTEVAVTTRGEINKGKIQAAIDAYNALPIERKVMVSNFETLKTAAANIGVTLKTPVEETIDLINNIGTVIYKQYPEYTGLTFRGPWGFGYTQLKTNPNSEGGSGPYSLTYRLIVDEFDKITENSSFGTSSNEWGMYYLMQSKKFVLVKGGFDYTSDKAIVAEAAYELEIGLEYDVTYFYGASENAILVNGEKVLSYTFDPEAIAPCAPWDGYSITLPKECYVHVISYKYVKEDGTVIADEKLADFGAVGTSAGAITDPSGNWVSFGDGYRITEFKATHSKYDSNKSISLAEVAYAALSDDQKKAVTNYDTLTAAREAYDKLAGEYVDSLIAEIGDVSIEAGESAIVEAEAAYADLTETQKAKVTSYDTLTAARAKYIALVNAKKVDDLTVIAAIAAANINDTTAIGGSVQNFPAGMGYTHNQAASDHMVEDSYLKVSFDLNYNGFTATEDMRSSFIAGTTNSYGSSGKIAAGYDFQNQRFFIGSLDAFAFNGKIDKLDAEIAIPLATDTWYNIEIVYDQRDVYIFLDGEQILTFTYEEAPTFSWYICAARNVSFMLDNFYQINFDEDDAQAVTGGSSSEATVPETTRGEANKTKIQAAVDAFNKLTGEEIDLLNNFDALVEAAAAIGVTVVDPAVEEVETLINNNVKFVSLANAEKVKAVKAKYDALADGQKAKVKNAAKLIEVYDAIVALESKDFAVDKVNSMIAAIKGMTAESLADATVLKGVMGQFREVIDGDRYPGYSDFNDSNSKIAAEKYMIFDYDVIVYDYDAVNGYPLLGGYTGIDPTVQYVGYDFLKGGFIVANTTGMDNGGVDPEGVECFVEKDFELGVWHHFRVIHDGNKITIEFDGEVVLDHTSNYDRNYAFYIYYPQWINCDLVNMTYIDKSGEVRKSPITKDNTSNSPGWTMVTLEETTLGAENKKSIERAKAAYDALTDEQKALVTDVAALEAALALIVTPGDANNDGKVNVKDAMAICKFIADWPDVIANMDAADITGDGKVNVKDAMAICKLVANS